MKTLLLLLLLLAPISCRSAVEPELFQGSQDPALLPGDPWRLERIASSAGTISSARAKLTVHFTAEGRLGGAAGPNGYGGRYTATPAGQIRMEEVVTTLIGGPEAERAGGYLSSMVRAHSFEATPAELRLYFGEAGHLHFRRQTQP
ncbi:MAG TPA: META domain-containing protein [Longimicrobiaceae bacterium]|nr:META domain-containing protein [Longimicrobiaceae bacterium]